MHEHITNFHWINEDQDQKYKGTRKKLRPRNDKWTYFPRIFIILLYGVHWTLKRKLGLRKAHYISHVGIETLSDQVKTSFKSCFVKPDTKLIKMLAAALAIHRSYPAHKSIKLFRALEMNWWLSSFCILI